MTVAQVTEFARKWTSSLWQRAVLFGVAYFVCALAGSCLSVRGATYVSFWMPAGLSVAVLLLNRTRDWPWLLLAVLPANYLFDLVHKTSPAIAVFFCGANLVEIFLGAWMVRTFVADCPSLKTLREFIGLMVFGAVINSMASAAIGAGALVHFGISHSFARSWAVWWGSDVMAILVLAPFILTWFSPANGYREVFNSRKKYVEAAVLLAGLSVYLWYLLVWDRGVMSPNKSPAIPFLLWAGLRFGRHGATAICLYTAIVLSFSTAQPFFGLPATVVSSSEFVFALQTVLAMAVLVSLVPAIVLKERDQAIARLRESEEHFRNLTNASFEGVAITENGHILDVNDQMLKMFGYEREEMIGREVIELVAPESRVAVAESIREGREVNYEHWLLRKDGTSFIAEARAKMMHIGSRTVRMTALRDITGRKKVEQALRESEEKFSKAFHTSPDSMSITDLETGRYLEVNEAHEKIFGFSREESVGRSPLELGILPNTEALEQMRTSLKEDDRIRNREVQVRARDGRVLTILYSAESIELGGRACVLRVVNDITDRKRAEEALRESEKRFRSYFELASVGFAITSREMRILAVNDEYTRILGYTREELLKKTWAELTYQEDMKPNESVFEQTVAGKIDAYTINKRLIRKDGQIIYATISARCVRKPDGSPDYFVSLLLDITEREQAIEREQRARAEYTLQLIASQEAERERIAGELHDSLGQSLSLIKNHAQLVLLQKKLAADTRKEIETISETTSDAIAEMRRISQDLHPYQLDHLGLTGALNALIESVGNAGGIAVEAKFDMVDDAFPRDTAANLYRVVQEGLNNILKHSQAKSAHISLERDLHEIRLVMADDGQGFNQGEKGKGMGLKNIAERARIIGGRLKMDSTPGKGTRVEIIIPISPRPE
ncbi:MAG TPA: PAS domain S-box protein [Pseudomonadales bacterium]|nr:PAS domain S-box protein [Pseudomonadales bacterium]